MRDTTQKTLLKNGIGILILMITSFALSCPTWAAEFEPILRAM